jgi:AAA+ superfamily predicted ATPase
MLTDTACVAQGIFCATTNRCEDLDPAFMWRFDMKIRFDYLDKSQREMLMKQTLRELGCSVRLSQKSCARLVQLGELTPGDFAMVHLKWRLSGGKVSQDSLLSALVHEVECKNVHKGRSIGFAWAH